MRRARAAVDASILECSSRKSSDESDSESESNSFNCAPFSSIDLASPVSSEIAHGREVDAEILRTTRTLKEIRKETLQLSRKYELERKNIEVEIKALHRQLGPGALSLGVVRQTETCLH